MATSLSVVNQKLGYARVLLQELATPRLAQNDFLEAALADAVVAHLMCGFHQYLQELAYANGIKPLTSIDSLGALQTIFIEADVVSAEMDELQQLSAESTSWLAHLYQAYEQQWALPDGNSTKLIPAPIDDENLILLTAVEDAPDIQAQLSEWYTAFTDMVQRHRQNLAEY